MSLLDIGTQCAHPHCSTIDFLPTICPSCTRPFCGAHITTHYISASTSTPGPLDSSAASLSSTACPGAFAADTSVEESPDFGSAEGVKRAVCEVEGCVRRAVEGAAGLGASGVGVGVGVGGNAGAGAGIGQGEAIAKRVRCDGCGGAYCVSHRHPTSHACSSPTLSELRHAASAARHTHAAETIAKHFPAPPTDRPISAADTSTNAIASTAETTTPASAIAGPSYTSTLSDSQPAKKAKAKDVNAHWTAVNGGGMKAKREAIMAAHRAKRDRTGVGAEDGKAGSSTSVGPREGNGEVRCENPGHGRDTDVAQPAAGVSGGKGSATASAGVISDSASPAVREEAEAPHSPAHPSNAAVNPAMTASSSGFNDGYKPSPTPVSGPAPHPRDIKLWHLHTRKVRMAATPLDPSSASSKAVLLSAPASSSAARAGGDGMRRCFEWAVGTRREVEVWERSRKWIGTVQRAWVPLDMSAGRALDLLVKASKTPRPAPSAHPSPSNTSAAGTATQPRLALIELSSSPTAPRPLKGKELKLSERVAGQVEEGTLVVLVRDWADSAL